MATARSRSTSPLTFITSDSHCPAAQEAIKVHVLRRRHRGRRWGGPSNDVLGRRHSGGGQLHVWECTPKPREGQSSQPSKSTQPPQPLYPHCACLAGHPNRGCSCTATSPTTSSEERLSLFASAPYQIVSIGAYPSQHANAQTDVLVNEYISRARQSKVSYEFLQCFRQSSASFSAFLALSAWYYTLEKGIKSPLDSDELEGQALKEVTSNISLSPSGQGCGIIMAVALLANLKECRGENSLAEWHWNGLKQMINIRGGILRLRMYEGLHAYLFWMDTLVCNAVDYPLGQSSSALTGECLLPAGREFVRFHDRIGTNLRAIPVFEDTGAEFSNPIWTILQRPAYIRGKYAYMKWHRARLACVMYLAALTVWKQPEPNNVSVLRMIEDEILLREQSYPLYPEELFHIILRVSNEEYLYLIIYLVSRLMSVTKQLPLRDQSTTYELLSAFLGFSHCPSTVHVTLKEWEQLSSRFPTVLQSSLAQE